MASQRSGSSKPSPFSADVLFPGYPKHYYDEAEVSLVSSSPAWELTDAGVVIRANSQALLLWGAIDLQTMTVQKDAVLGRNVFDIFVANFPRLDRPENHTFWQIKSSVFWRFYRAYNKIPSIAFMNRMVSAQHLERVFRSAPSISGTEWEYTLAIQAPPGSHFSEPLKFQTCIAIVRKRDIGFRVFARYDPSGAAIAFLRSAESRLHTLCGTIPFVYSTGEGGESKIREHDTEIGDDSTLPDAGIQLASRDELNRSLAVADAMLDESTKNRYPVVSFEEAQRRYPDRWVAMATTRADDSGLGFEGRLFASASDRRSLFRKIRALRTKYPGVVLIDHFTGEYREEGKPVG